MSSDDDGGRATSEPEQHGDHHNKAFRDLFDAARDIHLDKGNGQHLEVHIVNQGRGSRGAGPRGEQRTAVSGTDPDAQGDRRRRRHRLTAGLIIGAVVVLVTCAVVIWTPFSGASQGAAAPPITIQLVGKDVLFDDMNVKRELLRQGIVVQQTLPDSRAICTDARAIASYDISDTSAESAQCYENLAEKAGKVPDTYMPYQGLVVILTYKPIVALLERLHIATVTDGVTVFDVAQYLKFLAASERWIDIPGNTTYPNKSLILLWTTNPKKSNLGAILADIAYAAQNHDDPPVSIGPHDPYVPVIAKLFTELGELKNFSVDLLDQFLSSGMGEYPMATVYESQYLSSVLTHGTTEPNLTVMYPTPDSATADALVAWSPHGKKLIAALQSRPMITLLEDEGYRTVSDEHGFANQMAKNGLAVPDQNALQKAGIQFSNLANSQVLTELINAVARSQPN